MTALEGGWASGNLEFGKFLGRGEQRMGGIHDTASWKALRGKLGFITQYFVNVSAFGRMNR